MNKSVKGTLFFLAGILVIFTLTGCPLWDKVVSWIPVYPALPTPSPTPPLPPASPTPTPAEAPSVPTVTPASVIASPTPAAINLPTPVPGGNPVIIDQIPRVKTGWGGGIERYYDPVLKIWVILETAVSSNTGCADIIFRDPAQGGAVVKTITGPYEKGYHDCAYDSKRNVFWLTMWGGPLIAIPVTGGAAVKTIDSLSVQKYGVCYDPVEDRLWVAYHIARGLIKVNPDTGAVEQEIAVKHNFPEATSGEYPSGIVKVGGAFWITMQGAAQGIPGWLFQVGMDGKPTGRQMQMPPAGNADGVGGITSDGAGGLWVKGGKGTAIYKVRLN
jgi:hypothetical protein